MNHTTNLSFTPISPSDFNQVNSPKVVNGANQEVDKPQSNINKEEVTKTEEVAFKLLSPSKQPASPKTPPPPIQRNLNFLFLNQPTTPPSKSSSSKTISSLPEQPTTLSSENSSLRVKRGRDDEIQSAQTRAKLTLVAPQNFQRTLTSSAAKASSTQITQIHILDPYFEAFPELQGAIFLGNGAESAVFNDGTFVYKIPISIPIKKMSQPVMKTSEKAERSQKKCESYYNNLIPIFEKLTFIRLTPTEFLKNNKNMYFMKQPYYPTDVRKDSLTTEMAKELRGLIINKTRADLRPSNFKVDKNNQLQLVDWNIPDDDEELDIREMERVWNAIDPELGALLTEENNETFQKLLISFFV
jgi:hypothetical protein